MRINYKMFTKHAEKVAKNAPKGRDILKGIYHGENDVAVTDSFRLYQVKNINAPRNAVLCAVTGEEIEGKYPELSRLVPDPTNATGEYKVSTKPFLATLKAMDHAARADGTRKADATFTMKSNILHLDSNAPIEFSYTMEEITKDQDLNLLASLLYLTEAVDMFDDMRIETIVIRTYGNLRPFTIVPANNDDVLALISPKRRF